MTERKSYGQFCGLARALDRVGDRWTLLIVRELLLGDRTFRELEEALTGISPSLLTRRLNELSDDGLVARNDAPQRSKSVAYGLTPDGRSLEAVVIELIRWGSRWMVTGPANDRVDARWAPLALRALLEGRPARRGCVHLDVEGVRLTIRGSSTQRHISAGHHGRPDATISASLPAILEVAADVQALETSTAAVSGDIAIARDLVAGGSGSGGRPRWLDEDQR